LWEGEILNHLGKGEGVRKRKEGRAFLNPQTKGKTSVIPKRKRQWGPLVRRKEKEGKPEGNPFRTKKTNESTKVERGGPHSRPRKLGRKGGGIKDLKGGEKPTQQQSLRRRRPGGRGKGKALE